MNDSSSTSSSSANETTMSTFLENASSSTAEEMSGGDQNEEISGGEVSSSMNASSLGSDGDGNGDRKMEESIIRRNPFEEENLFEILHQATFTPSVFAKVVSPGSNTSFLESPISRPTTSRPRNKRSRRPPRFRWHIDHIAMMNPAEIDVSEVALQATTNHSDEQSEARLQSAIQRFFDQPTILPSPWKPPDGKNSSIGSSTGAGAIVVAESPCPSTDDHGSDYHRQTPGTDWEQSPFVIRTRQRSEEDINKSVFLLSSSSESENESPMKKRPIFNFDKTHRTSLNGGGDVRFSSPEISPIKEFCPQNNMSTNNSFPDISPIKNHEDEPGTSYD